MTLCVCSSVVLLRVMLDVHKIVSSVKKSGHVAHKAGSAVINKGKVNIPLYST